MINRAFMSGYYQGVVEVAPAAMSAARVEELAVTMTIQHLRHAGVAVADIHDFLIEDIKANDRVVSKYINDDASRLEAAQARLLASAFEN